VTHFDFPIDKLLGREPLHVNLESVRGQMENRVVLVTGAAGSIGSDLCRQIIAFAPKKIVCVDRNEAALASLKLELLPSRSAGGVAFTLADAGDAGAMRRCFAEHHVELVLHTAAHKHVPEMETRVAEGIANNIFALATLLDVADEHACRGFALISSDKAVYPASVMGTTKRVGELMLATRPLKTMRCVSVRFGNVLGSSGSVVPILMDQLRRGQTLTITHPEARRFLMTSREAVSLVLQAFTVGQHGDILVLNMGDSVNIVEMARSLIRLSGISESPPQIEFIGLRPGEKLEEHLFYADEAISPTSHEKIKRVRRAYGTWPALSRRLKALRASLASGEPREIRARLKEIVPEYREGLSVEPASNNRLRTPQEFPHHPS
jgi:FlaA1/EpsC-like NDP-sugar epimerase